MNAATHQSPIGPTPPARDPHRLRAHEIWGGNEATSDHISVPGFEAWVHAIPHEGARAGGDLRFVSTCAMGQIVRFTLADIAGHGEEASEAAVRLRAMMRRHMNMPNPTRFAQALNGEFSRLEAAGGFATALITTYFAPTDHLIVCNAGHPRPLLHRAGSGTWELFDHQSPGVLTSAQSRRTGIANLPLGIVAPANYPQFAVRLDPGDVYIAYTDALIEAADGAGRPIGEAGLLELVRRLGAVEPAQLGTRIVEAVAAHRAGRPADDDTTVLVLHHTATNPPDGAWAKVRALGRLVGLVR